MCLRLNYEILIVRGYVRHNVIMYVIIINVILTSLSIYTSLLSKKSLAWLFDSGWHNCSTVTDMIVQQSLPWLFNNQGRNFFSMQAEFFSSDVRCWRIVPCTRNTTNCPVKCYNYSSSLELITWWIKSSLQKLEGNTSM